MAAGAGRKQPPLPDFHLWHEVTETVLPLKPRRRVRLPDAAAAAAGDFAGAEALADRHRYAAISIAADARHARRSA